MLFRGVVGVVCAPVKCLERYVSVRLRSKGRHQFIDLHQKAKNPVSLFPHMKDISPDESDEKVLAEKVRQVHDFIKNFDTTLTPEQKAHSNKIKKLIKGGPNSPRSIFRDVPRPDEIVATGNFTTMVPENAEALIDYALSKVPLRAGPRNSRRKKRMDAKFKMIREQHVQRKQQQIAANLRKQAKGKKQRQLVQHYKKLALEENAKRQSQPFQQLLNSMK